MFFILLLHDLSSGPITDDPSPVYLHGLKQLACQLEKTFRFGRKNLIGASVRMSFLQRWESSVTGFCATLALALLDYINDYRSSRASSNIRNWNFKCHTLTATPAHIVTAKV